MDGRIAPAPGPEGAGLPPGRACYSTARWTGSGIRFEARHVARLVRDAAALGIGAVDPETVRRAFHELCRAAFPDASGVVRVEASGPWPEGVRLVGTVRPLGPEPSAWRALTVPFPHEIAGPACGAKLSRRPAQDRALEQARAAGCDEALLFDRAGRLVEGARTNLVFVETGGLACAPPASRGAVAGVALEIVVGALADLVRRDCARERVTGLRELVALNAVRGAVPIVELDGRPVGDGRPGPISRRLAAALDAAP